MNKQQFFKLAGSLTRTKKHKYWKMYSNYKIGKRISVSIAKIAGIF